MENKQRLSYIWFLLKRNKRMILLTGIAMIVFFPLMVLTFSSLSRVSSFLVFTGRVFLALLGIVSAIINGFSTFSYINNKQSVDLYHALPLKRKELFLAHYLSGLFSLLLPVIIAWLISLPLQLQAMPDIVTPLWISFLCLCVLLVAIYSLIVFVAMNTGTTADAMLYTVIVISLPLFAYLAYHLFFSALMLGYSNEFDWDALRYLSPVVALFVSLFDIYSVALYLKTAVFWLILSIAMTLFAMCIYRKRASESAGKPFANPHFFPIVSVAFCMILQIFLYAFFFLFDTPSSGWLDLSSALLAFAMALVVYLILDVIAKRSYQHLFKAALLYLCIGVVTFAITLPVGLTKGFGFMLRVPELSDIASVTVDYDDPFRVLLPDAQEQGGYLFHESYSNELIFTDLQEIAVITDLHHLILNNYEFFGYDRNKFEEEYKTVTAEQNLYSYDQFSTSNKQDITFTYHLKDGRSMKRYYLIDSAWCASMMTLARSEAVMAHRIPMAYYRDRIASYRDVVLTDCYTSNALPVTSSFQLESFLEAYQYDYLNMKDAVAESLDYTYYGRLQANTCVLNRSGNSYCDTTSLPLDSRFTTALAYLEKCGCTFAQIASDKIAYLLLPDASDSDPFYQLTDYNSYNYTVDQKPFQAVRLSATELEALKGTMRPYGIADVQTYKLVYTNDTGPEYKEHSFLLIDPSMLSIVNEWIDGLPRVTEDDIYSLDMER